MEKSKDIVKKRSEKKFEVSRVWEGKNFKFGFGYTYFIEIVAPNPKWFVIMGTKPKTIHHNWHQNQNNRSYQRSHTNRHNAQGTCIIMTHDVIPSLGPDDSNKSPGKFKWFEIHCQWKATLPARYDDLNLRYLFNELDHEWHYPLIGLICEDVLNKQWDWLYEL